MSESIKEVAQTDQVRATRMMLEEAEPRFVKDGWQAFRNGVYFKRHGVKLFPFVSTERSDFGDLYWVADSPLWIRSSLQCMTLSAYAETPEGALARLESLLRQDFDRILSGLFGPKSTNDKENENE